MARKKKDESIEVEELGTEETTVADLPEEAPDLIERRRLRESK